MRHDARRRLLAVLDPIGERGEQRAHGPGVRVRVRLLLAHAERLRIRQRQLRGRVLRARLDERAHVWRVRDVVLAERIGEAERLPSFPHLQRRRDMEDQWACAGRLTAIEHALLAAGNWIALARIGEREVVGWIEVIDLVTPGAARLAEADVERHQAAADVRVCALKGLAPILVWLNPSWISERR